MSVAAVLPARSLARFANRGQLAELVAATLAINLLSLALPVLTLQIYDRILPNPGSGTLQVLVAGVAIAIGLEIALRLARACLIGWSGAAFEHRASCEVVRRLLDADFAREQSRGVGEQLHRLAAIGKLKDVYSGALLATLTEVCFVVVFLGVIAYLASWLVAVPLIVLALFVVHALIAGARLKDGLRSRDGIDDERYDFLIEALQGVHTIKSFALEGEFERRYEHFEKRSGAANFAVTEAASHTFNVGMVFSHLMIVSVIVVGAFMTLDGVITSGALIASVLLSGRIMQPVQRALGLWARFQDIEVSSARAEELLATPVHAAAQTRTTEISRSGSLALRKVSFRRAEDEPQLLREVDLELKIGQAVAISGAQGSGKSALLRIVAGLLAPSEGEALIDGVPAASIPPRERVVHVGVMPTDAVIFRGTIRDNITRFGLTPESDAREVAALLGVDRDVAKLPSGFDTALQGDALDVVPPGLRQRIAIARALAPKPRILVFDNADKGLDREGYATVFDVLARLKDRVAMIIVSDDENIRSLASDRRELVDGRLIMRSPGRPDIARAGYRSLRL